MKPERLRAGLDRLAGRYRVAVDDGVFSSTGYLAGDDDRRAAELNRYLADPDVRAIVIARGGYGVMRILDRLDADALRRDPKPIVGFSDGTALCAWAHEVVGVRAIHGPTAGQIGELPADDVAWLYRLLEDPSPPGELPAALSPLGAPGAGVVEGPLVGGNLTLLAHLVATPYQIDLAGALVLLEEVGERPYQIDRYLTRIELAGAFAGARAALVGDLTRCADPDDPEVPAPLAVIDERLRHLGLPGLAGLPVGHGTRNLALPYGGRCAVDFGRGVVTVLEGAVG